MLGLEGATKWLGTLKLRLKLYESSGPGMLSADWEWVKSEEIGSVFLGPNNLSRASDKREF